MQTSKKLVLIHLLATCASAYAMDYSGHSFIGGKNDVVITSTIVRPKDPIRLSETTTKLLLKKIMLPSEQSGLSSETFPVGNVQESLLMYYGVGKEVTVCNDTKGVIVNPDYLPSHDSLVKNWNAFHNEVVTELAKKGAFAATSLSFYLCLTKNQTVQTLKECPGLPHYLFTIAEYAALGATLWPAMDILNLVHPVNDAANVIEKLSTQRGTSL